MAKQDKLQDKRDKKLRTKLTRLVRSAEDAAERAEKAAKKAKKQRKRAEAALDRREPVAALPPAPADRAPDEAPAGPGAGPSVAPGQLATATKAQLLDLARAAGIPGRTRMGKDELVAALGGGR